MSGMRADGPDGEPFRQGDPIDLDADHPRNSPANIALTAVFRAELEPDEQQTHRVIARLPLIQARARRRHRFHQVLTSGLAVMAVVAVTTAASTRPSTHRTTAVAPARTSPSTGAVPTTSPAQLVRATPKNQTPTILPSMLTARSVRNFAGLRLIDSIGVLELGAQPLVAGVCVEARQAVPVPDLGLHARWPVKTPSARDPRPAGLSERWWSWTDPGTARGVYQRLEAQVTPCSAGPGRDGRGVTRRLEAPEIAPADKVLVTAASDGRGNQAIQMLMLVDDKLVQLDAVIPDGGRDQQDVRRDGMRSLTPVARLALARLLTPARTATR